MRNVDDELVEPAVIGGDAGTALERQRMHAVHAEAALDHVGGSGLGGGEIASLQLHVDEDIAAPFLVDQRCAARKRIPHRHDRR